MFSGLATLLLAAMLPATLLLAPPAARAGGPDCGTPPCAVAPPGPPYADGAFAGRWTFAANGASWTVDVGADGRIDAEGERSVTIGGDAATYVSTLSGRISPEAVVLTIAAERFSLPNFVPGPPTICTGVPAGPGRYQGSCASDRQRIRFTFTRS